MEGAIEEKGEGVAPFAGGGGVPKSARIHEETARAAELGNKVDCYRFLLFQTNLPALNTAVEADRDETSLFGGIIDSVLQFIYSISLCSKHGGSILEEKALFSAFFVILGMISNHVVTR